MLRSLSLLLLIGLGQTVVAATVEVGLKNIKTGESVEDAVITLHPPNAKAPLPDKPALKVMDQINKRYIPHVLPVVVGTPVSFPNKDQIRHHVYSIDEVKPFELPLYKGTPTEPIIFDVVGAVSLGCNIHDHMSAHIYVVDTPWFERSNSDGFVTVDELPAGEYVLDVWHPRLKGRNSYKQTVILAENEHKKLEISLNLRRLLKKKARVRSRSGGY